MTAALSLHDLHFTYGKGGAVRGVSLSLAPGDCYGFLGHNGAGKTTVLRLALGLLRPRRGSVHIFGVDALRDPVAAHASVGALVERPGFHLTLTARANLRALARLQGMPRALASAETDRVLEQLGLASFADRRVGTFSLGMRQRLGIAQALLGKPQLLLLDEPTNGLDPEGIAELRAVLQQLTRDEGTAVLISSHQLAELDGLCNRIGVLRDGAMVVEGDLAHLREQLAPRHRVRGEPLATLERQLAQAGFAPERLGDELRFDLRQAAPAGVLRDLLQAGEVHAFAPEPVTLEAIYRRAADLRSQSTRPAAPAAITPGLSQALRVMSQPGWPRLRALAHELRLLRLHRSTFVLLALPSVFALWRLRSYHQHVQATLARVQRGELFSADAGSGFLAYAQAMQSSLPLLAVGVLWLGSQSFAADLQGDTLRNTLVRAVRREHVVFGKSLALVIAAALGWLWLHLTTLLGAGAWFGFGNLEDISRNGDRQLLADLRDVQPVLTSSLLHAGLPVLGLASVGLAASILARRPARALIVATLLVVGGELLRDRLRDHAGWLLTSHLQTGLRDDTALGYLAGIARGAADAAWPWAAQAVWAPLAWLLAALLATVAAFRRLAVA